MSNTVIEIVDVVNAAKIMEAAIKRNAFTVEELAQVSPVVAKFIAYSNEQIKLAEAAEKETGEQAGDETASEVKGASNE